MSIMNIVGSGAKKALTAAMNATVEHPVICITVAAAAIGAGIVVKNKYSKKFSKIDPINKAKEAASTATKAEASEKPNYAAKDETAKKSSPTPEFKEHKAYAEPPKPQPVKESVKETVVERKENNVHTPEYKKPTAQEEAAKKEQQKREQEAQQKKVEEELQRKEDSAFPNKATKIVEDFRATYARGDYSTSIADSVDSNTAFGLFVSGVNEQTVSIDITPENYVGVSRLSKRTSVEACLSQNYTSHYMQSRAYNVSDAFQAVLLLAQLSNSIKQDMGREANYIVEALDAVDQAFKTNPNTSVGFRETVTISRNENSCDNKVLIHHVQVIVDCGDEYKIVSLF